MSDCLSAPVAGLRRVPIRGVFVWVYFKHPCDSALWMPRPVEPPPYRRRRRNFADARHGVALCARSDFTWRDDRLLGDPSSTRCMPRPSSASTYCNGSSRSARRSRVCTIAARVRGRGFTRASEELTARLARRRRVVPSRRQLHGPTQ